MQGINCQDINGSDFLNNQRKKSSTRLHFYTIPRILNETSKWRRTKLNVWSSDEGLVAMAND